MKANPVHYVTARLLALFATLLAFQPYAAADDHQLQIQHIRGAMHQFHHTSGSGIVLEGSESLIVGNPGTAEEAEALYIQLLAKFNKPARYVFATRAGRAEGLPVFAKRGAITVAHQAAVDAGNLSVDVAFEQQLTLYLDDHSVQLIYPGESTGAGTSVALFPEEQALYAIDVVSVNRLPDPALIDNGLFPEWFNAIEFIRRLPFVYLLSGHDSIGIRNDAVQHGYFLRELQNRVKRSLSVGVTEEDLPVSVELGAYQQWAQFDAWSADVVRAMAKHIE